MRRLDRNYNTLIHSLVIHEVNNILLNRMLDELKKQPEILMNPNHQQAPDSQNMEQIINN